MPFILVLLIPFTYLLRLQQKGLVVTLFSFFFSGATRQPLFAEVGSWGELLGQGDRLRGMRYGLLRWRLVHLDIVRL